MSDVIARDVCVEAIGRVHEFATDDGFPNREIREIRTRLSYLHDQWNRAQRAHVAVLSTLHGEEQRAPHLAILTATENQFLDADAIMQDHVSRVTGERHNDDEHDSKQNDSASNLDDNRIGQQRPAPSPIRDTPPVQVGQLPVAVQQNVQLPWHFRIDNIWGEFDGDKKKWPAFHDSFKSRIYDDPSLPAVQKLQILRAALKGKAAKSLGEWQVRDCNFEPVWQRLKELYEDPYATSKELLQKIFSLKKLESPNGLRLQIMSNVTQEVSRSLKALKYPAEHYDLIFIHSVHGKLDEKTSVAWDLQRQNDRPTLDDFTTFLDRQARALSNAYCPELAQKSQDRNDRKRPFSGGGNGNGKYSGNGNNHIGGKSYHSENKRFKPSTSNTSNAFVKVETGKCAMCSEDHPTRKCKKFLDLSLTKRKEKAKSANLVTIVLPRVTRLKTAEPESAIDVTKNTVVFCAQRIRTIDFCILTR